MPITALAQLGGNASVVAGPGYNDLKYSISFADQAQLAYDGMKLKQTLNQSFLEIADLAYYNGKYFNAAARYLYGLSSLPQGITAKGYGLNKVILNGVDTAALNIALKKTFSSAVTSVGMMYQTRGKFIAAETMLSLAMDMRARTFGKTSREYINSLQNMAVLKKDLGQYDESERMFNYLVPTFKKLFTANSFQYVIVLNNKAMLLAELGRSKEAIQLLDEALTTGATTLDSNYFDYERILTNRALLAQEAGDLQKAEQCYLQAIAGMERKGFDDHPDYNNVLVYYGSLRVQKNDVGVESFLDDVADKVKRRYGSDHPTYAKALENSGDYYLNQKKYKNAKDVYERVADIQLKELGDKHKDYLNTLMKLALCEWSLADNNSAASDFQKAIKSYLFLVNSFFRTMSEPEKANFWRMLKPNIDNYISFIVETGQNNPALLKDAYNLWIKTKGIIINSTRQTRNVIMNSNDTSTRRIFNDWLNLKTTLASYYSSPLEDLKEDKIDLSDLEQQANAMEKDLSRRSTRFASEFLQPEVQFDDVRSKLKTGEAAVEILRIIHNNGENKGESEYVALITQKDDAPPTLLRIGKGADLEKYCAAYKRAIKLKVADPKAYENYWQPFEKALTGIQTIYVSVDGVYNSINLNTIQKPDGTYLLDDYNIVLLPNTKNIVAGSIASAPGINDSNAMLIGSPVFGNDQVVPPLPGTREEVQEIDTVLTDNHMSTKIFVEQNASEENMKSAVHPAVLHVATHGFFNANVDLSKDMAMGVQVSKAKDNALLRSGLLLNGAANVYNDEPTLTGSNNGILYAYEVMNLDLQGTRLVVLSACETGNGEIVNGEGVYGLCRAFQVAGASKIIMSLWKVDDQATRLLMTSFYTNWMKTNDPQQAFIQAQKSLKEKMPQPYYWGAFVLVN